MSISINSLLKEISYSQFYIKNDSSEIERINKSIKSINEKLNNNFNLLDIIIFGSYDRDTILPRKYDSKSDIDFLIIFDLHYNQNKVNIYLDKLKKFANEQYKDRYGSVVKKDFPSITINLHNINFDLVPAIKHVSIFNNVSYYIPDTNSQWILSDIYDIKKDIQKTNKNFNNIVKPIVRLLKAWNSYSGYTFQSYQLESILSKANYYDCNYETGFFHAVEVLNNLYWFSPLEVKRLKENSNLVQYHLRNGNKDEAMNYLSKILPI